MKKIISMFFSLLCIFASLATQGWLFYEVGGLSRSTCEGIGTESLVTVITTSVLILMGYCCSGLPGKAFISAALSAVVVVFLSRLTVYIPEADHLCAVGSCPSDDILVSADTRERATVAAWASLSLFAIGLLLLHCGSLVGSSCSWLDCFGCGGDSACDEGEEVRPKLRSGRKNYGYLDTESCKCDDDAPRKPRRIGAWVVAQ